MNVLLIVETPNKAKTLRNLFPEFTVFATLGLFIDLTPEGMGTRQPEHIINYAIVDGKQRVLSSLRSAAKVADIIYVATNPDREGEALAAHVVNALDKPHDQKVQRITPVEITRNAFQNAIANKRSIDWSLVRAYEAQRVVERYIGRLVSSELTPKFASFGLNSYMTSGRLQSIALKLIVERENEIALFKSTEHYGITASVNIAGIKYEAHWKPEKSNGKLITNINDVQDIATRTQTLRLVETKITSHQIAPPQPLTTSRYLRLMSDTLNLTVKQSMDAAQTLYERGLITYHRTDSINISSEFVLTVQGFAQSDSLPLATKKHQTENNNTDRAECLRVTNIYPVESTIISANEHLLHAVYHRIWLATLESQLEDGEDNETFLIFENNYNDKFVINKTTIKLLGWREAKKHFSHVTKSENVIDAFTTANDETFKNELLHVSAIKINTEKTELPTPYTETTLIEKLETLGISRPNTYVDMLERIIAKKYVNRCENSLQLNPQEIGIAKIYTLNNFFSFMDYGYAASIEIDFDNIATSHTTYSAVVSSAWHYLEHEIAAFKITPIPENAKQKIALLTNIPIRPTHKNNTTVAFQPVNNICTPNEKCPHCQKGNLRVTQFTHGEYIGKSFVGCSVFPDCHYFQMVQ